MSNFGRLVGLIRAPFCGPRHVSFVLALGLTELCFIVYYYVIAELHFCL